MRRISKHLTACLMWVGMVWLLTACGTDTTTTISQTTAPVATTVQASRTIVAVTTQSATTVVTTVAATPIATTATTTVPATTVASITTVATTIVATTATTTFASTTATQATTAASLSPGQFVNPVINQDFADPGILKVGNTYYVYATNSAQDNIQAAKSTDLVHWQTLSDALPTLPAWSEKGHTWAPGVSTTADGKSYVMYFVARDTASSKQCIGVATSATPEGPFTSAPATPFICQTDEGGSIDPSVFVDTDGTRYVVWKNDGNCCAKDTYIYVQKTSPDGLSLVGKSTQLIHEDQGWEGNLVEAPVLWKHNNKYDLFYSANNYAGADYAIGYALADNILGPYTKPGNGPFVQTIPTQNNNPPVIGPGGEDIVVAKDGTTWMLYHSWDPTISYREVNIDQLTWDGDKPVLHGPMVTPENVP